MSKNKDKIVKEKKLSNLKNKLTKKGQKLVFTNGCFDIIHVGHVRFLKEAKKLGDKLFVAVNSDESVKKLKGESRPYNNINDRMEILSSLECVDFVHCFHDKRVTKTIKKLKPDIYAKGGDYNSKTLNKQEYKELKRNNTQVYILNLVKGKSTTKTIEKINNNTKEKSNKYKYYYNDN